ncbi:MAG: DUF4328 domain-containing protein [Gemmatimonadota bacterium]
MTSIDEAAPETTLERRGKAARYALLVMVVVAAVSALSSAAEYAFVSQAAAGKAVSMAQAEAIDMRQRLLAILYGIGLVTTGILFIRWQRAAYDRAAAIVAGAMPHSKAWTIWGWIVPIAQLFVPYRIVREIYTSATRNTSAALVGWWWFFWLAGNMASYLSLRLSLSEGLPQLVASSATGLAGDAVAIPAALIAARIIADVNSSMQRQHMLLANAEASVQPSL